MWRFKGRLSSGRERREPGRRSPWMDAYIVVLAGFGVGRAAHRLAAHGAAASCRSRCRSSASRSAPPSSRFPTCPASASHPMDHLALVERLTRVRRHHFADGRRPEDRPAVRTGPWRITWRLLAIAMPLTILALAFLGQRCSGSAWRPPSSSRRRSRRPIRCSRATFRSAARRGAGGRGALRPDLRSRTERRPRLSLRPSRHRARARRPDGRALASATGSPSPCSGSSPPASASATASDGPSAGSPSICRTAPSSPAPATASWRSGSPASPTGSPRWRTATASSPSSWRRWRCAPPSAGTTITRSCTISPRSWSGS